MLRYLADHFTRCLCGFGILSALCLPHNSSAENPITSRALLPAIAVVTSCSGTVKQLDEDGKKRKLRLRETLPLNQTSFSTASNSSLFLCLSNGIGLGLSESTSIRIQRYEQSMINPMHAGLNFENSVSHLRIQTEAGKIAVAFNHLNPQSKAEFILPVGTLIVHSGQFLLEVDPNSACSVIAYKGTATFYQKDSTEREFVAPGKGISISPESVQRFAVDQSKLETAPMQNDSLLIAATEFTRKRILFRHNPDGEQPLQQWILPERRLDQAIARPFQFKLK
mgnify:CR=1 FL=1|tara:strand:+ start:2724 stop:3566 length:843 start_codon:yes stop_codon:yes gene_type:complete